MSDTVVLNIPRDATERLRVEEETGARYRERIVEIVIRYGARNAVQDVLIDALAAAMARMRSKELAEASAIIHGMQDGSLARDQMGIIERANARIAELEEERAAYIPRELYVTARAERAEAECKAMREVCIGVDHVASIEERYGAVFWTNTWIETVAKARAALKS